MIRIRDIENIIGDLYFPEKDVKIRGVSIDSRNINKGEIFIALKGEKTHGAFFAKQAIDKGAIIAFVPYEFRDKLPSHKSIVFVEDTLKLLKNLAKIKRNKIKAKVIGITGSVGKTTTKNMVFHVLRKAGKKVFASPKSYNNIIGISLSILNSPCDLEYLILEMGINEIGEMDELIKIAEPQMGILTKIGIAHLEGLKSPQNVAIEKGKLFVSLPRDGFAVINRNSVHIELFINKIKANKVLYELRKEHCMWDGEKLIVKYPFQFSISVPSFGMAENAIAAIKLAEILKIELPADPFEDFEFPELRMNIIKKGNSVLILDSYNANPTSVEELLNTAQFFNKKERYIFLGDMLELGEYSEMYHREIARMLKSRDFNGVFTYGNESIYTHEESKEIGLFAEHFSSKEDMKKLLNELLERDSVILLKGSRKLQIEDILEGSDVS